MGRHSYPGVLEFTRHSLTTRRDQLSIVQISNFLQRNSDWSILGWACPLLIQLAKGGEGKGDGRESKGEAQSRSMASRSAHLCLRGGVGQILEEGEWLEVE